MDWNLTATVILGLATLLQGIALYRKARRDDRTDEHNRTRDARVDGLEKTVTSKAEEVVKSRFELLAMEMKLLIAGVQGVVTSVQQRLENGDEKFDKQGDHQVKLELKMADQKSELQNWVREHFGSREEVAATAAKLEVLQIKVAQFEQRLNNI